MAERTEHCPPPPNACPACGRLNVMKSDLWIVAHNDQRIIARGVTANEAANGRRDLLCIASMTYGKITASVSRWSDTKLHELNDTARDEALHALFSWMVVG